MNYFVHPTALVEEGVTIGDGTRIWDSVHVRHSTRIGSECIIGEKSHVSYSVQIGDRVKINAFVYICTGVVIEDGVMLSAGVIFTNDRFPRATTPDLQHLQSSDPNESTGSTLVRSGATIGAGALIGSDLTIGCFAMVGMGSVVTKSVPDYHLCVGNPARSIGYVCKCGIPLLRFREGEIPKVDELHCRSCGLSYTVSQAHVAFSESVQPV
jgi:acetyltransferase-like isoleucine patch superfamily enzyme